MKEPTIEDLIDFAYITGYRDGKGNRKLKKPGDLRNLYDAVNTKSD